jgi:hypothetical protein
MKFNKSNTTVLMLTLLVSHSLYAKKKSSNSEGYEYFGQVNSHIMKFHPQTGDLIKEIPIINIELDDGLVFNYSIYLSGDGSHYVPTFAEGGHSSSSKTQGTFQIRSVEGDNIIFG